MPDDREQPNREPLAVVRASGEPSGGDQRGFRPAISARLAESSDIAPSVSRLIHGDERSTYEVREISVGAIEVDGGLRSPSDPALADLASSVRQHGLVEPIFVRRLGPGQYSLLRGHRRLRAAIAAGLDQVPAVISSVDAATIRALDAVSPGRGPGTPVMAPPTPDSPRGVSRGKAARREEVRSQLDELRDLRARMEAELAVVSSLTRHYEQWLRILESD